MKKNEKVLAPILTAIGSRRLRELTADDVRQALAAMADRYSTAAVALGHNAPTRAIRHAEGRDLVGRNVATLIASLIEARESAWAIHDAASELYATPG